MEGKDNRLTKMEEFGEKVYEGVREVIGGLRLMDYRVGKLEEDRERKEYSLKMGETKDSIDYWETF